MRNQEYVYFVAASYEGLIKIGYSNEPAFRLSTLQKMSPSKLSLIGVVVGGLIKEQELHCKFRDLHSHGEWFRAESPLCEFIMEHARPWPLQPNSYDNSLLGPSDMATVRRMAKESRARQDELMVKSMNTNITIEVDGTPETRTIWDWQQKIPMPLECLFDIRKHQQGVIEWLAEASAAVREEREMIREYDANPRRRVKWAQLG